jgi:acyl dehydratase
MLRIGMTHTTRLSFTRDQVDRYCDLTGDRNAIHREIEAARLRFPDIADVVVPGGLIQTSISAVFGTEFPGDGTLGLTFHPERIRKPICPGDEILARFEVVRIRGAIVEMDVRVENSAGAAISSAKAMVIPADDGYRRWWEGLDS